MSERLWSKGWVPPLTVSPHTDAAYQAVRVLRTMPPVFKLDSWWGWQEHTLAIMLSRRADGLPVYSTVVVVICRQNGKTTLLFVAVWVWLASGYRVGFTLHERQKAREKWEEIAVALTAVAPQRYKVSRRPGSERITDLSTGGRFDLLTPDDAGGRSDTYDVLVVDEAAHISPRFLRAAEATTLTRPNAQTILISSAGTEDSEDLARARSSAHAQQPLPIEARDTGIIEFAAKDSMGLGDLDVTDETVWERCVPTLDQPGGARREALRKMCKSLKPVDFAREILGVWSGNPEDSPITDSIWAAAQAEQMPPRDELINVVVAGDCDPDQSAGSVAVAGFHPESRRVWAALASNAAGTAWMEGDLADLARAQQALHVVMDAQTPVSASAERLTAQGFDVQVTGAAEMARSCAGLVTLLHGRMASIVTDDALTAAAVGATRRPIADAGWAFKRRNGSLLDISPIVAVAIAVQACYKLPT